MVSNVCIFNRKTWVLSRLALPVAHATQPCGHALTWAREGGASLKGRQTAASGPDPACGSYRVVLGRSHPLAVVCVPWLLRSATEQERAVQGPCESRPRIFLCFRQKFSWKDWACGSAGPGCLSEPLPWRPGELAAAHGFSRTWPLARVHGQPVGAEAAEKGARGEAGCCEGPAGSRGTRCCCFPSFQLRGGFGKRLNYFYQLLAGLERSRLNIHEGLTCLHGLLLKRQLPHNRGMQV